MIYRHGDVVIRKINKLPKNSKQISERPLAYGEVTGHSHRVIVKDKTKIRFYEDDEGRIYFKLETPAKVIHEEHKPITLNSGIYTTKIIREYDYIEETINEIKD